MKSSKVKFPKQVNDYVQKVNQVIAPSYPKSFF